ncbi:MAG: LacI family DNA-binding transcriptional regulator [Chloroflexi bacterium]|nr:LacI family DNA-binding transcriptional regulator [Chloroflexota bacterium]
MSTIGDVAKRAGVSTMTVSRVINNSGYISQETRERVERAIAELGYVPNALARSLRFKRTKTIALILTDITNPFFTTLARGIEDAASEQGFSVIFCNTDESKDEEAEYLSVVAQKQVDGVLLVPASSSAESVAFLRERGIPCVVLDRRVPDSAVDTVRGDSEAGAHQLTRHLLELGHRRIALLNGPAAVSTAADRLAGYRRALDEAGLGSAARVYEGAYTMESGYRMALQLLADVPRPTALFAANNFIAIGALRALREAGLRVPDEISLAAFDDLPAAIMIEPFFTVVGQPAYEMGQQATWLLLNRLAGQGPTEPQEIVLPAQLIVRQSSAPPPAAR